MKNYRALKGRFNPKNIVHPTQSDDAPGKRDIVPCLTSSGFNERFNRPFRAWRSGLLKTQGVALGYLEAAPLALANVNACVLKPSCDELLSEDPWRTLSDQAALLVVLG